jgi:Fic family protein
MNNIERLYKEWLSLQPMNPDLKRQIDQQFMIDFNYNSNHLEGNTLTYGQTKLLLLFGDTIGNASMQDYEEMKAHNVGLELMKITASDKERQLSDNFIRELNKTILVRDFWKTSRDGDSRYQIKVGAYKTRPNSVITPTGEVFNYASPEETPSLMSDLVRWHNAEEQKGFLSPFELATLFHYRYIRIHPFEDGNGRIARLLMNYILLRHNYPMIVVRTDDRNNYLKALHQCDLLTGKNPSDGAFATYEQAKPLIDYIADILEKKLTGLLQLIKGEVKELIEAKDDVSAHIDSQKSAIADWFYKGNRVIIKNINQHRILELLLESPSISIRDISEKLNVSKSAIQKHLATLKEKKYIFRKGGTKGKWVVKLGKDVNEDDTKKVVQ